VRFRSIPEGRAAPPLLLFHLFEENPMRVPTTTFHSVLLTFGVLLASQSLYASAQNRGKEDVAKAQASAKKIETGKPASPVFGDYRDEIFAEDKDLQESLKKGPKGDFERTIEKIKIMEAEEKKRGNKLENNSDLERKLEEIRIAEQKALKESEIRRKEMQKETYKRSVAREKEEQKILKKVIKTVDKDMADEEITIDDTSWRGLDD
jgi:Skp family chaperone for outer membrane proteins